MSTTNGLEPSSLHIHVTCEAQRLSSSVASFLIHQGHLKSDPQDPSKAVIQFSSSGWHASTSAVEEVADHSVGETASKKPKPKGKASKKAGAGSSSTTEGGSDSNLASPALGPSDTNGNHSTSTTRFPRISFAEAEYLCRSGVADSTTTPATPFDVVVCLTQSAFNTVLDFYMLSPSSATVTQQRWPSDSTSIGRRRNILLLHINDPTTISNLKAEIDRESSATAFSSRWVVPYSASATTSTSASAETDAVVANGVQRLSLLYGQFLRSVLQEWRDHPALAPSMTADERVLLLGQLVANSASQYEKLKGVQLLYHLQVE